MAHRSFVSALIVLVVSCTSNNNNSDDDGSNGSNGSSGSNLNPIQDGGSGGDAGGSGTTSSALTFAIVGDTRPTSIDDTTNYPSSIITKIYQDLEAATPKPAFVIGTGDYQYASTTGNEQAPQINMYMTARAAYSGPFYPAMGNHECTGYTDSNCGTGNPDGITKNMTAFITAMLAPISQTDPYYVETVTASDNSWTAKFVIVACNAWTSAQSTWLGQQLAVPTTYTFVVRHESVADMSGTACAASQTIVNAHPLTLLIVGHTHEYSHESHDKEIINGIGGAPLTSGTNYGYTIVNRTADGKLTVTTYDYSSNATLDTFTIQASGAAG